MHNVYLLPAGISALFAIMFLVAWFGSIVESGRQRRRRKTTPVRRAPAPAEATAAPEPGEPEAPPEEPAPEPEPAEEMPEPREPETPAEPTKPDEEPRIRPMSRRDRSGISPE